MFSKLGTTFSTVFSICLCFELKAYFHNLFSVLQRVCIGVQQHDLSKRLSGRPSLGDIFPSVQRHAATCQPRQVAQTLTYWDWSGWAGLDEFENLLAGTFIEIHWRLVHLEDCWGANQEADTALGLWAKKWNYFTFSRKVFSAWSSPQKVLWWARLSSLWCGRREGQQIEHPAIRPNSSKDLVEKECAIARCKQQDVVKGRTNDKSGAPRRRKPMAAEASRTRLSFTRDESLSRHP